MTSSTTDLVLLTEKRFESHTGTNLVSRNVQDEATRLKAALEDRGIQNKRVDWSRADFDWTTASHCLFRTTWDYFDRWQEFSTWLENVKTKTTLINSADIIQWNTDKHYLADLKAKGCPTIPTHYIPQSSKDSILDIASKVDAQEVVIKPTVSGAGRHTYRHTKASLSGFEKTFESLNSHEDFMIQPFLPDILEHGEVTLVLFDGKFSHAIRKTAGANEFRIQDDHGGSVHHHKATQDEIDCAEQAFSACKEVPVYGRVDMVRGFDGKPKIMELELVEPELWLRFDDNAAGRFAEAIKKRLFRD